MSEKLVAEERKSIEDEGSTTPILHRIIGSAVIIGLAVVVFSWLLGSPSRNAVPITDVEQVEEDEEVFVSRIVPSEKVKKLVPNTEEANIEIEANGIESIDSIKSIDNNIPTPLKSDTESENTQIEKVVKSAEVERQKQLAISDGTQFKALANEKAAEAPKPKPEPKPQVKQQDASQKSFANVSGWVVQLGAYSKLPGANATVDQLKEKKILAKINRSTDNNKTIYRVFVGPFKNRAAAEDASKQIAQRIDLKPFVRKQ